ncbi:hypothetical protein JIG36_17165 [Actinoplanes sp. LDG1-06]|uniref:Bacterial toxin 28 domain-containing protein n=1 Tax=Paractinoplanes ovalisporus TaxID=2810368 RepID=A0ABS2ADF8_9ACTN|nr:polymorphic toxin type 28 domain-containing protein [Actinoplanes ovalisporus]MBM2617286.1 hypothetical protein [Actinoplanes ovalisporus]
MTELGATYDPLALVPGDPAAIRANASSLLSRSADAERAGDGLVAIDTDAWTGVAAEEFREKFHYEPAKWYAASDSLGTAGDVLNTYAHTLEWAQGQAADAIRQWDEAEAQTRAARQQYDQTVAGTASDQAIPAFVDAGEPGREAARSMLGLARQQVDTAGRTAARFLDQEADAAPRKRSWLRRAANKARDIGANVVNNVASVGNAMLNHPLDTLALAGGIALTGISASGEGLGLALDATGVGAVAGVPINVVAAAGIATGATVTVAAGGSIMQHAAGEDAVAPASGSAPPRAAPSKTDRLKEHLTPKDLEGARRELNGEVVATKGNGVPYDHVDEVRSAQRGLVRRIAQFKRLLGDTRISARDKAGYQSELSEASRLLDHSEQFVPRP